jgi:transcriptional regulator with AAA-type ATPase domain
MTQLLLYSKKSAEVEIPEIIDLDIFTRQEIVGKISQQGIICLASDMIFQTLNKDIERIGYFDCGVKHEKIDLKRSLKFDEKKHRNIPKKLIFKSDSVGAFKRGLKAFYLKHYSTTDPCCLIIIPEFILKIIIDETQTVKNRTKTQPEIIERDPFFRLLNVSESDPKMIKLAEVFIGNSIEVRHTRSLIYRASLSDSPVLILGESGTGKDVIATQIFENSSKYKKGFFRINCSALPESLLEGELFGYKKGSYTSAVTDKIGLFAAAENGTIFLDEIGDLSLANQTKILHAVEKKEIRQIGSNKGYAVNVRIIAATNRNLDAMILRGTFREDLYYRISTFRINSPSLCEHPEDIPLLASSYWKRKAYSGTLTTKFLDYLKSYQWPGNVRELYSLLNSIVDYFGHISPLPEHVDAIRKSRQELLLKSKKESDPDQLLRIKGRHILINIQNILRSIKIEIRPIINSALDKNINYTELENLRNFIRLQIQTLEELCQEPSYFMSWDVFRETARYKYVLANTVSQDQISPEIIRNYWMSELKKLDDQINQRIMDLLWRKIDM